MLLKVKSWMLASCFPATILHLGLDMLMYYYHLESPA